MNVVITGSSKGIGYALAKEFLQNGFDVVLSSTSEERIQKAAKELESVNPDCKIYATTCDVNIYSDLENLAKFAKKNLGQIDFWINNAGINGSNYKPLHEWPIESIKQVIETNLVGTLYGCKAAIGIMQEQKNGKIFNMEGMGSNGMASPNMIPYGSSKASFRQLNKSLKRELEDSGILINNISPGIVLTDFIIDNVNPEAAKIFNILANRPDKVAKILVKGMMKIQKSGKTISVLTRTKAFWKFMTAGFRKNRYFEDDGTFKG